MTNGIGLVEEGLGERYRIKRRGTMKGICFVEDEEGTISVVEEERELNGGWYGGGNRNKEERGNDRDRELNMVGRWG